MRYARLIRLLLLAALPAVLLLAPPSAQAADSATPAAAAGGPAAAGPVPAPPPEPKAVPLASISASAEAADAATRATEDALATPPAISSIAAELDPFRREFNVAMQASRQALAGRNQRDEIGDSDADLQALQGRLSAWEKTLTRRSEELEAHLSRLADLRKTWQATREGAAAGDLPKAVLDRIDGVLGNIERVRKRAEVGREGLFTLQDRVNRLQSQASDQRESLKQAMAVAVGGLLSRDAAPLWGDSGQPAALEPSPGTVSQAVAANLAASYASAAQYIRAHHARMTLLPVIVLVFLVGLWIARRQLRLRIEEEPDLKAASWLFERPLAATVLATVLCSPWVLQFAPREINLILLAVALPPTILILRRAIDPRLAPFLHALVVLYVLSRMLEVLDAVPTLERALFQVQMLATIGVLSWLLRRERLVRRERAVPVTRSVNWTLRGIRASAAGFTAALAADLLGYTQLGRFVADATLGSIYTAVILYAGVQVVYGLIRIGLNLWPLQNLAMVRSMKGTVERRARLTTRWLAIVLWILSTLDLAALLDPIREGLAGALKAQYQVGEISLSPGAVLMFVATIWGAVLVSRLVRFVLDEEVFTRLALPGGIPYALTTILHYVLLLGAVLVAIMSTGINLDRFTIIAGALGVGVGFGLQSIVNNFVSGLILLFERPIKVGDSVEMANRGGQIQRIGIRACVMRTGDGAEIIVPNSMLITSEVTNWTLSDRQRRIEIPINIAYGNDPERVMELLTGVATAHDDILTLPAPDTLFAGFGPHALEFKLGAWTGRPERAGSIRSEMCVEIYKILTREGIEIPYPQSTVHLRGFDREGWDVPREQTRHRANGPAAGVGPAGAPEPAAALAAVVPARAAAADLPS